MYEIDQLLFMNIELPKFDIRNVRRRTSTNNMPNYDVTCKTSEWNTFARITALFHPKVPKQKHITLKVQGTDDFYIWRIKFLEDAESNDDLDK